MGKMQTRKQECIGDALSRVAEQSSKENRWANLGLVGFLKSEQLRCAAFDKFK